MVSYEHVLVLIFYSGIVDCRARIVGGFQTTINKYPYAASLRYDGKHICGAAIIAPNIVISAAHCIRFAAYAYSVRVGSTSSVSGGVVTPVNHIVKHPNYTPLTADFDVSLIFLSKSLTYTRNIRSISLYTQTDVPYNAVADVVGWGTTNKSDTTEVSPQLKGVKLPVISNKLCLMILPEGSITENMICAGNPSVMEDACTGDSGGPMVYNGRLLGIISWGFSCADPAFPGIYTFIPNMLDFIRNETNLAV